MSFDHQRWSRAGRTPPSPASLDTSSARRLGRGNHSSPEPTGGAAGAPPRNSVCLTSSGCTNRPRSVAPAQRARSCTSRLTTVSDFAILCPVRSRTRPREGIQSAEYALVGDDSRHPAAERRSSSSASVLGPPRRHMATPVAAGAGHLAAPARGWLSGTQPAFREGRSSSS